MSAGKLILLAQTTTYRANPFAQAAQRLGIEVVYATNMHPDLAEYWQSPLGLQFDDPDAAVKKIVAYARRNRVGAVIAVDDSGSLIAARAAQALGLPHNSGYAAQAARDKYRMRRLFAAAGVPSPGFARYSTADNPAHIGAQVAYPCVLKPLNLSGSRGVIRADSPAEFEQAFKRIERLLNAINPADPAHLILVEEFIPGAEVALEGLLDRGRLNVLALFDKPDPLDGPFFEETIYVTPSRLSPEAQDAIAACVSRAVAALGLFHGPVHAELRVNDNGPRMLEVAGRSIGGLCSKTLRFGNDVSLEELILRQAFNLDFESFSRQQRAEGVMMIPIPGAGMLTGVQGVLEAEQVPGVTGVEITAQLNHPLVPLPEGESYLGFIFAQGESPGDVETALRQAHQMLSFELSPLLPLL